MDINTEKITDDVIRYPEYRRRLKICRIMVFIPLAAVVLNIVAGIISIGLIGGFTVDNTESASLFMEVFLWTALTGGFAFLCLLNLKAPCILSMLAFIAETVFCTQNSMKFISFAGVMGSLITLYYVMEHIDLAKLKGYPLFREEVEFLRPSRPLEMQIDAKKKTEERKKNEERQAEEKRMRDEELKRKIEMAQKNKENADGEDNTENN